MPLLTTCCYVFSLRAGTNILLVFYWWMSVTYVVLLMNYFSEHTVIVSLGIGLIFLIWVACSTAGLYGVHKTNPYYLIPQIISDISDCIQVFIDLIYELITGKLLIPRYTTFGANWRGDIGTNDGSITTFLYNFFDERYPLPAPFAIIDLGFRIYFVMVFMSCYQDFRNKRKKKEAKKMLRRTTVKKKKTAVPTTDLSHVGN